MPKVTKDVTLWLTECLHKVLTKIIMAKENYPRPYYILVIFGDRYMGPPAVRSNRLLNEAPQRQQETIDLSGKFVIHNRLVLTNKPPVVPMVNTSLWRIDNKIGEARCVYILPPDKPMISGVELGESSRFIWKSAKNAPLIWSMN